MSVCPSVRSVRPFRPFRPVRPSVRPSVRPCVRKLTPVSAVGSQNVTNRSFLVSVKSEKYAFWVTLRPLGSMSQDEVKIHALRYSARHSRAVYRDAHMFSPSTPFFKFWVNFSSYRAFNRCIKPFLRSTCPKMWVVEVWSEKTYLKTIDFTI